MARGIPTLARRSSRLALGVLALLGIMAAPVAAQQVGGWPQFQGAAPHPGSAPGPAVPYRQSWRFVAPDGPVSGCIIVGQDAIAVGATAVYAIRLTDGSIDWQMPRAPGPLSMPAMAPLGGGRAFHAILYLEGGKASSASTSGSPTTSASVTSETSTSTSTSPSTATAPVSTLVAFDLRTRKELWRTALTSPARSGVTVDGERAFVGGQDGTVTAVSLRDGSVAWTATAIGQIQSPPAVADGRVFVAARNPDGRQSQVLALDEQSGQQAWEYLPPAGTTAASGLTAGDGLVVVGTSDRYVRGLDAATGEVRWSSLGLTIYSPVAAPLFSSGTVVIADVSGGLYRIDAADGHVLWDHQLNELIVRSSPVLVGSTVLVGLNDGRLAAIDLASGHLVWQSQPSPGLLGSLALSPDTVVAVKGGDRAGLLAFEHDPKGTLIDVPSPSVLDPEKTLANYALAFVVMAVLLFVPFRLLRSRIGPAFAGGDGRGGTEPSQEDG